MRLISFPPCGTILSFHSFMYFMLTKSVCVLLKMNFPAWYALWGYYISLLLVLHKLLEPDWHFALKIDSIFLWCKGATYGLTSRLYCSFSFFVVEQLIFQVHCTDRQFPATSVVLYLPCGLVEVNALTYILQEHTASTLTHNRRTSFLQNVITFMPQYTAQSPLWTLHILFMTCNLTFSNEIVVWRLAAWVLCETWFVCVCVCVCVCVWVLKME